MGRYGKRWSHCCQGWSHVGEKAELTEIKLKLKCTFVSCASHTLPWALLHHFQEVHMFGEGPYLSGK